MKSVRIKYLITMRQALSVKANGRRWHYNSFALTVCQYHCLQQSCVSCLIGYLSVQSVADQEPLLYPGPVSEGQFYSPPESMAGNGLLNAQYKLDNH